MDKRIHIEKLRSGTLMPFEKMGKGHIWIVWRPLIQDVQPPHYLAGLYIHRDKSFTYSFVYRTLGLQKTCLYPSTFQ